LSCLTRSNLGHEDSKNTKISEGTRDIVVAAKQAIDKMCIWGRLQETIYLCHEDTKHTNTQGTARELRDLRAFVAEVRFMMRGFSQRPIAVRAVDVERSRRDDDHDAVVESATAKD
jgi:hypothetical protein